MKLKSHQSRSKRKFMDEFRQRNQPPTPSNPNPHFHFVWRDRLRQLVIIAKVETNLIQI